MIEGGDVVEPQYKNKVVRLMLPSICCASYYEDASSICCLSAQIRDDGTAILESTHPR